MTQQTEAQITEVKANWQDVNEEFYKYGLQPFVFLAEYDYCSALYNRADLFNTLCDQIYEDADVDMVKTAREIYDDITEAHINCTARKVR